jgi:hypothetical protein
MIGLPRGQDFDTIHRAREAISYHSAGSGFGSSPTTLSGREPLMEMVYRLCG